MQFSRFPLQAEKHNFQNPKPLNSSDIYHGKSQIAALGFRQHTEPETCSRSWESHSGCNSLARVGFPISCCYGTESQQKTPKLNCLLRHLDLGEEASGIARLFMQNSFFWVFDPGDLAPDAHSRSPSLVSQDSFLD